MRPYYIYAIENILDNKIYVGQTVHMYRRWTKHKSDSKRVKLPLYFALNKYGVDNFIFYLLEVTTIDTVDDREKYWIAYYHSTDRNAGYNMDSGGQDNKIFSEEHRKKISIANSGSANGMYGKNHSESVKQKIRLAKLGSHATEETKKKQSIAHQGTLTPEFRAMLSAAVKDKRRGEDCPTSKLTNNLVLEIREKHSNGQSRKNLAEEYGVTKSNIDQIINRKTWSHI